MACLCPGQALLNRISGPKGGPVTTVAGTGMLDSAELDGQAPLFVDAFYSRSKKVAHIILNMKSFKPSSQTRDVIQWGSEMKWSCEWSAPGARLAQNVAVLRGSTNVEWAAQNGTVEESFRDETAKPSPHWSLVISCPTVPTSRASLNGASSLRLNLRGEWRLRKPWALYERIGIPVSEARFVRPDTDFALCTMVYKGPLTTSFYLQPWVFYNLAAGFQQLLIYVEENDTSWIEDALKSFILKGQVTIVPFHFGSISEKRLHHARRHGKPLPLPSTRYGQVDCAHRRR